MDTVALNSNVVPTIADNDLVAVADSQGQLRPISFANLMKAVQKAGNFRLDTTMSQQVVNGDWVRVARSTTPQFSGILGLSCSYSASKPPKPAFIALGGYNASYGKLDAHWINKNVSIVSAVRFFKEGNICYIEVKFAGDKTDNFYATLSNNVNMALVPAETSTATEPIAEIVWGGVIGLLPITYNSAEKGGAHADQGFERSASIGTDGNLAFESYRSLERAVEYLCDDSPACPDTDCSDLCGCERSHPRLDADEQPHAKSSSREKRRGRVYTDFAIRYDCEDSALLLLGGCSANLRTKTHVWVRQRYLAELESNIATSRKEVAYAD